LHCVGPVHGRAHYRGFYLLQQPVDYGTTVFGHLQVCVWSFFILVSEFFLKKTILRHSVSSLFPFVFIWCFIEVFSVIVMAACQALIAIGFLVYGIVLLVRLKQSSGKSAGAGTRHRQVVLKVVIVMASFSLLFGIRAVFFFYRPVSGGQFIDGSAFLTFAYLAPDTS
jgi:hypothetical protein